MSKKVLIRKQAGGGIMYTREVGGRGQGGFMQDLAAVRGGAMGLNPQGGQSFIPGAQLGDAKPTGMQRLAAGANLAGRGLAAALTGLQTAYGLQGGNVGALGSVGDTYAQNVQGLTANRPTEAQQAQDMATRAFQSTQAADAQRGMTTALREAQRAGEAQSVPLPTATPAAPAPATPPPAGLPTPPVPASTPPAQTAPTQPGQTTLGQFSQQAAPSMTPTQAAQMLPTLPQQSATPTTPSMSPTQAASMLPTVPQQPTPQPNTPQFSGPMNPPAAPVAVSQPVDNGLTPTSHPVLMPQQTHEDMRQQVAVRPPVATPYTPGSGVNPFAADKKPIQPHMVGRQTIPGTAYGGQNPNTVHPDSLYGPNFGIKPYASAVPSLGDDPSINWDDFKRAFVSQVFDEFGDMLHKADPHVVGAVVMRAFLEKMLRK